MYSLTCNAGMAGQAQCINECNAQFRIDPLATQECVTSVQTAYKSGISQALASTGGGCFPMNARVLCKSKGSVTMDDLSVGDLVMTASECGIAYSPIVSFAHLFRGSRGISFEFVEITLSDGTVLPIHQDHMLPFSTSDGAVAYLPAGEVKRGDQLKCLWIDGGFKTTLVERVAITYQKGLYCPITENGTIVVNGVLCSCYSPPSKAIGFRITHEAAHMILSPLRVRYSLFKQGFQDEGVDPYCKALLALTS